MSSLSFLIYGHDRNNESASGDTATAAAAATVTTKTRTITESIPRKRKNESINTTTNATTPIALDDDDNLFLNDNDVNDDYFNYDDFNDDDDDSEATLSIINNEDAAVSTKASNVVGTVKNDIVHDKNLDSDDDNNNNNNDDFENYYDDHDADRTYQIALSRLEHLYGTNNRKNRHSVNQINKTLLSTSTNEQQSTTGNSSSNNNNYDTTNPYIDDDDDDDDDIDDNANDTELSSSFYQSPWLHYTAMSNRRNKRLHKLIQNQQQRQQRNTNTNTATHTGRIDKRKRKYAVQGHEVEEIVDHFYQQMHHQPDFASSSTTTNINNKNKKQQQHYRTNNNDNDDEQYELKQKQKQIEHELYTQLRINQHLKFCEHLKIQRNWKRRRVKFLPLQETFTTAVSTTRHAFTNNTVNTNTNDNPPTQAQQLHDRTYKQEDDVVDKVNDKYTLLSDDVATMNYVLAMKKLFDKSSFQDRQQDWKQIMTGSSAKNDCNDKYDNDNDDVDNQLVMAPGENDVDDDDDATVSDNNDNHDDNINEFENMENRIVRQLTQTSRLERGSNAKNRQHHVDLILQNDHWTKLFNMNYIDKGLIRRRRTSLSKTCRNRRNENMTNQQRILPEDSIDKQLDQKSNNGEIWDKHHDTDNDNEYQQSNDSFNVIMSAPLFRVQSDLLRWQLRQYLKRQERIERQHQTLQGKDDVPIKRRIDGTTVKLFPAMRTSAATRTTMQQLCPQYFPLSPVPTFDHLAHIRNVLKLAASQVYVASTAQSDPPNLSLQAINCSDRIIQLLWNESFMEIRNIHGEPLHSIISPVDCALKHSANAGYQLYEFFTHVWHNRAQAASELEVGYSTGKSNNMSYSLIGSEVRSRVIEISKRLARRDQGNKELTRIGWLPQSSSSSDNVAGTIEDDARATNPLLKDIQHYYSSNQRFKGWFLRPHVKNYDYVAGRVPPVPSSCFPLDETGIVFGPQHPFCAVSYSCRISEKTLAVTIGAMTNKVLCASDGKVLHALKTQFWHLMMTAVDLNRAGFYKMKPVDKVPLLQLYRAVSACCGLVCSGLLSIPSTSEQLETDEHIIPDSIAEDYKIATINYGSDSDSEQDDIQEGLVEDNINTDLSRQIHSSIKSLVDTLSEDTLRHNGLSLFTNVHCVFGILKVVSYLPTSAGEIIWQPVIDKHVWDITVFTILRDVLEHLEEMESLVQAKPQTSDDESTEQVVLVEVGLLEYNIHEAIRDFARCVELDPSDLASVCWYLGALTMCMIIASGIKIGSGAHCFASTFEQRSSAKEMFLVQFKTDDGEAEQVSQPNEYAAHEIRPSLPNFQELRVDTLKALKLLLHIGTTPGCGPRVSRAIASFLEWNEAMALLVGPIFDENTETSTYNSIIGLHNFHSNNWLIDERQNACPDLLKGDKQLDVKVRLQRLVVILENEPNVKAHWTNLIKALGPFAEAGKNQSDCERFPYEDRVRWWGQHLLHASVLDLPFPRKMPINKTKVLKILCESFSELEMLDPTFTKDTQDASLDINFDWIDEAIERASFHDSQYSPSLLERELTIDECLPRKLVSNIDMEEEKSNENYIPLKLTGVNCDVYEMVCYKTFIACHLYKSIFHPDIERAVVWILLQEWKTTIASGNRVKFLATDSYSARCLCWLFQMGVNVVEIVKKSVLLK